MIGPRKTIHSGMTFNAHDGRAHWDGALATVPGGVAMGLASGTQVATSFGWRPVEAIAVGDKVLTFDDGMQEVTRIERNYLWESAAPVPMEKWPLHVPAGALGNTSDMVILPGQSVMLESDTAEALFGDPFTLVPAAALEGYNGIARIAPQAPIQVITLHFDKDQVVFANVAALLFCPANEDDVFASIFGRTAKPTSLYHTLSIDEAEILVDCILEEAEEVELWQTTNEEIRARVA